MQQLTCKIDSSNSFYYLFFSFIILELKPLVFEGQSPWGKIMKKVPKSAKNYETILPFSCCPLVFPWFLGPATTQNLVVKFDGEICGGVLVENASDDFPSKRSSKISFQTSPEVRHQFRRKLRQLHSGNRWCLDFCLQLEASCLQLSFFAHSGAWELICLQLELFFFVRPEKLGLAPKVLQNLWGSAEPFFKN